MKLRFLGAAGTVTGSRYLLQTSRGRVLVDCGLFQGYKVLRQRNWKPFPVEPGTVHAVVLTHAHIDHTGWLPVLFKNGFDGPVYCSGPTYDLARIMLPDAARLQEEEAEYANRKGFSRHKPALPLYDRDDAQRALARFEPLPEGEPFRLRRDGGMQCTMISNSHLLGACSVLLRSGRKSVLFSGDLGRDEDPLVPPSAPVRDHADALTAVVVESTYGDRLHPDQDPATEIARVVSATARRGGVIIVPSFAVERAQVLLYYLYRLRRDGRIPPVPVYLNSPLASKACDVFVANAARLRIPERECREIFAMTRIVDSVAESRALNALHEPAVIVSASGMATGGRVLHHLKAYLPDERNTVLFAGYQAPGTRGAKLVAGAETARIHGEEIPVRAQVLDLECLSAHADQRGLLEWLQALPGRPGHLFVTHGDPGASDALRRKIEDRLGWEAVVPDQSESFEF
ncbi:MAG: MBL fold metallo-hydrolase [Burkholderiales bacterium]|nr:MAG: MBL fold metallo-hydrolase [Burkholderiales bacterium]